MVVSRLTDKLKIGIEKWKPFRIGRWHDTMAQADIMYIVGVARTLLMMAGETTQAESSVGLKSALFAASFKSSI